MSYPIEKKLVIGISSNALFDLRKEESIYETQGLSAYKAYQIEHRQKIIEKGVAFPFIKRLLYINEVYKKEEPIEVVLLSKNSAETGIRIFNSIKAYGLNIRRAVFSSGQFLYRYIPAFNISLFLSTDEEEVKLALKSGYAAGRVLATHIDDDETVKELRIAFDFDGVIADDEAERIYQERGIEAYYDYETKHRKEPLKSGPLAEFFKKLSYFQKLENRKQQSQEGYRKLLRTSVVTARSAPAHERAVKTLNALGIEIDDMFLLGGIEKKRVLETMRPHLYFDDQLVHLNPSMKNVPLVHIPFGIANE